jgi:hypothetical protein
MLQNGFLQNTPGRRGQTHILKVSQIGMVELAGILGLWSSQSPALTSVPEVLKLQPIAESPEG